MDIYFYNVDEEYINFLKKAEIQSRGFTCVPNIKYWNTNKFVFGTVMSVNGMNYFVPVTSYSKKQQDLILIRDKDKNKTILGSLRFTYMVPVPQSLCQKVDIRSIETAKAKAHISKELAFCRRNRDSIFIQAQKTYKRVINKVDETLIKNSCDFKVLEAAYIEYCKLKNIKSPNNENVTKSNVNGETAKLKNVANRLFNENISLQIENAELSMENETLKAQLTQAHTQVKEDSLSSCTPKPTKPKR